MSRQRSGGLLSAGPAVYQRSRGGLGERGRRATGQRDPECGDRDGDGAPDGNNREGRGSSAKAAVMDLIERMLDDGEIGHDECRELYRIYHIDPREVGYDG